MTPEQADQVIARLNDIGFLLFFILCALVTIAAKLGKAWSGAGSDPPPSPERPSARVGDGVNDYQRKGW